MVYGAINAKGEKFAHFALFGCCFFQNVVYYGIIIDSVYSYNSLIEIQGWRKCG